LRIQALTGGVDDYNDDDDDDDYDDYYDDAADTALAWPSW
jgi:hypothetical protein